MKSVVFWYRVGSSWITNLGKFLVSFQLSYCLAYVLPVLNIISESRTFKKHSKIAFLIFSSSQLKFFYKQRYIYIFLYFNLNKRVDCGILVCEKVYITNAIRLCCGTCGLSSPPTLNSEVYCIQLDPASGCQTVMGDDLESEDCLSPCNYREYWIKYSV